ncbi:hypothetical protein BU25DRAFT_257452 [Macroventuria anomochaeta]|uniref:Uncharacterized protein n=1 Tax=Macroventuria anomochaeta TaxID=301207 RepID=A0ACB6S803_9PLEO|nr:uncharacterized protein BU25DRAFT_257452 [Macroventuria anomochaeta]KAF2630411.1 hypothetical protein BU25DRAFT_257452 [Macroventuria anomochaeta]
MFDVFGNGAGTIWEGSDQLAVSALGYALRPTLNRKNASKFKRLNAVLMCPRSGGLDSLLLLTQGEEHARVPCTPSLRFFSLLILALHHPPGQHCSNKRHKSMDCPATCSENSIS